MLKIITTIFSLLVAVPSFATPTIAQIVLQKQLSTLKVGALGLGWKQGDSANYNIDMGIAKGTMVMAVASNDGNEIWLNQDMDLGFLGKQKIETLLDANTGEIKKMLVNGKEEAIPEQDVDVVSLEPDTITVPAGTFDCTHATLVDNKSKDEINIWASPEIPMSGMIKQVAPSQFGNVTVELTSFKKQ